MKRLFVLPLALLAACASRPVDELRAEDALLLREEGDAAAREERWEEAIELYTQSLKLNSSVAETWYRRGNAYVKRKPDPEHPNERRGWIDQAERDYTSAIERNTVFSSAYFNRAMVLLKKKRYQDAAYDLLEVTRLEAANRASPMLKDAELYLGDIWYKNLDDQQLRAIQHYDNYVKLGGNRPDVVTLVNQFREVAAAAEGSGTPQPPRGPTPEDEAAAKQLHAKILSLIPKGEDQRPEVAKLLEELTTKYAATKYVRDNEKGLKALLNAFKPKSP